MQLSFDFLEGLYGIYRCDPTADMPMLAGAFLSYTRTQDEVSIVCPQGMLPVADRKQEGYAVLRLHGPFDLGVTGVLAEVSRLLAEAQVPIFVISTYDTDYILIREAQKIEAIRVLEAGGHRHAVPATPR